MLTLRVGHSQRPSKRLHRASATSDGPAQLDQIISGARLSRTGWIRDPTTPDSVSWAQPRSETRRTRHASDDATQPFPTEKGSSSEEPRTAAPTSPPPPPNPSRSAATAVGGGGDVADLGEDRRGGVAHVPLPCPHHR